MKEAIIINTAFCLLAFVFTISAISKSYLTQRELNIKVAEDLLLIMKKYPMSAQYFLAADKLAYIRMGRLALYLLLILSTVLGYWSIQRIETGWQAYAATNVWITIVAHFCVFGMAFLFSIMARGKSFKIFKKIKI